jgi:hypothetical protein
MVLKPESIALVTSFILPWIFSMAYATANRVTPSKTNGKPFIVNNRLFADLKVFG